MNSRKHLINEIGSIAAGQLLCCTLMSAIFAALGKLDIPVILSAAVGAVIATLNFCIMAFFANSAAERAQQQDIKGGQMLIQFSYLGRLIGLFTILAICAQSGIFNLLVLVLPLTFTRPILTFSEFYKKRGEKKI